MKKRRNEKKKFATGFTQGIEDALKRQKVEEMVIVERGKKARGKRRIKIIKMRFES